MYLKHLRHVSKRPCETGSGFLTYLETLVVLLLLLVYDAKSEVYFVGLFEAGLHLHHLGEGFLGMIQRSVAVVQYTNAVPKLRLLRT